MRYSDIGSSCEAGRDRARKRLWAVFLLPHLLEHEHTVRGTHATILAVVEGEQQSHNQPPAPPRYERVSRVLHARRLDKRAAMHGDRPPHGLWPILLKYHHWDLSSG